MRTQHPVLPKDKEPIPDPINPQENDNVPDPGVQKPSGSGSFLAMVILESTRNDQTETQERFQVLESVFSRITSQIPDSGIIVFPAGMFFTGMNSPSTLYPLLEKTVSSLISQNGRDHIVCFGIDGSLDAEGYARDQIAVAIDRTGIIALGRKFFPQKTERGHVNLASDFNTREEGKFRIFRFGNAAFYLAMCYDSFGIKIQNLPNPGVNGLIELAHCFYPKGLGPSGESYFARHGFAGAARQWHCPVYGTGVFFGRSIPENWPTGVIWNQGEISTKNWNYSMNPLRPRDVLRMKTEEGAAVVRVFALNGVG